MKIIYSTNAPLPIWPYSQAVIAWNMIFVSWQIGVDQFGQMPDSVDEQADLVCKNIWEILKVKWWDYKVITKTTIFLRDLNDFQMVNSVYWKYFSHNPARSTVEVSNLPKWAMVEIECIGLIE